MKSSFNKKKSTPKSQDIVQQFNENFPLALQKREELVKNSTVYRIVNGIGDGIPGVTLDRYNNHYQMQIFDPALENRLRYLGQRVTDELNPEYFTVKIRSSRDGASLQDFDEVKVIGEDSKTIVHEYGKAFEIDLNDGVNTGLFLDMRENRNFVADYAKGKSVLNCFSYTCAFGVHAAVKGAISTVNVDISNKILNRGKTNYSLNNIDLTNHQFIKADVLDYFDLCKKNDYSYDIVIVDPPSFSRTKSGVFSLAKSFPELIQKALEILTPKGMLFFSTNNSQIMHKRLLEGLETAATAAQKEYTFLKKKVRQSEDYPGTNQMKESYLTGFFISVKN